ncbi:Hypp4438 [Branchiostoma lanceolatum]|uniref:Hypp4438 protein n=1 Tax=Branchiostoma lanceolatum TaxID=7740 RepID=A0A8K0A8V1_BRALA|nr:Hypp4438 [Branchiostoma lanceolatum]
MAPRNAHHRRWFETHWCRSRVGVNASLEKGLPAFSVSLDTDNCWQYCGPREILDILTPVQTQLEAAMVSWQLANPEPSRDNAGELMVSKTVLCKPAVPVDQLKCDDVRSTVLAWIRALNPGTTLKFSDPTHKPPYWPEDIPWAPPSKAPKGYQGDWTMAMRRVLRSMLSHVGEDPATYCAGRCPVSRQGPYRHPAHADTDPLRPDQRRMPGTWPRG